MAVWKTIQSQIGRQAFLMMGTKRQMYDGNSLTFDVHGCKRINWITVKLNWLDLYDIEFLKATPKRGRVVVAIRENVYAEDMHDVIESTTGLYLTL